MNLRVHGVSPTYIDFNQVLKCAGSRPGREKRAVPGGDGPAVRAGVLGVAVTDAGSGDCLHRTWSRPSSP